MEQKLKNKLIGVISLGCDKNRVDTEIMLTYLQQAGFKFTSDPRDAEIIIINTCAFIASARKEAIDTIDEMLDFKAKGKCEKLIVTGCMPQRNLTELKKEFPKVDAYLGIDAYPNVVSVIENLYKENKHIDMCGKADTVPHVKNRLVTTPNHYAYLKIADGCDNYCTFCTIPYIRGHYRSKPITQLVSEAKELVNGGAKELILVAQDVTKYGTDIAGKSMLVDLIEKLSKIKDLQWIRLLYCYPELVTDELLTEMMNNPKVCKYLDIPFQHISNNVLKAMNRHASKEDIIKLVDKINNLPQKVAIRTTMMVGFPGETEEDFKELCDFVKENKLTHVGFFKYSKEDGTIAAKLPNQVDEKVKNKRLSAVMELAEKNNKINLKKLLNSTQKVLYEGIDYDIELFFGRTEYQAPEIDNLVYFKSKDLVNIGEFYNIKITKTLGYDLKGEKV